MSHTLRLVHLDPDENVVARWDVPKTDEGIRDLAAILLSGISGELADEAHAEATRVRRGELPLKLLQEMKRPRGEIRNLSADEEQCCKDYPTCTCRGKFL